jgi:SAM-dependent methyltransferase
MAVTEDKQAQALSVRLWLGCLGTQEILCTYLGIRLGLYDALGDHGPLSAADLAGRADIAPRYAREWLEQQAVTGILRVHDLAPDGGGRRYVLPPGHREVLTASDSPLSRVAGILPVGAVAHALPTLLDAYRTGAGLTDRDYGPDWRSGHGASNRALYVHSFAAWIPSALPAVHARLAAPGARAADVACGAGWAAIALARAYPDLHVDGYEIDPDLIGDAIENANQSGLSGRVQFHVWDCTTPPPASPYDLVTVLDTLHEVPRPVEMLRSCRAMRGDRGCVLLMDARVADQFAAPADEIERFQYTTSVLHCLPVCLCEPGSAGTGTVMRQGAVRRYAHDAGFSSIETLQIDDRFHRFYKLA